MPEVNLDFDLKIGVDNLEQMIDTTEELYGFISNRLPEVEQEIEDTIEETELLIDYFTDTSGQGGQSAVGKLALDEGAHIAEVLSNLKDKINQVYDSLSAREDISQLLEGFIKKGAQGEAEFEQILRVINELNQVLRNLENLSMNAGIIAVKADASGAGFRVIAEEINNLSSQVAEEYDLVEENLQILQDWYDNFTSQLEKISSREEQLSSKYKGEIEDIFTEVLDSLQAVADILRDFMNHIQTAVEPIYDIVVLLQNQDIIRQNLENLIEIIGFLQQEVKEMNQLTEQPEKVLNRAVFVTEAAHLGQRLMQNILNQLDDSLFEIQAKFDQMNSDLNRIVEEGTEVFGFLAGQDVDQGGGQTSVDLIYNRLIEFVPQLTEQLEVLTNKYQTLISNQDVFYNRLGNLETGFEQIDNLANDFQKLEVLAKIEFTRMKSDDEGFIKDIQEAIERFIEVNKQNQKLYNKVRKEIASDYNQFIELSQRDKEKIKNASQIINESEEKLLMTRKLIKEAIQSLHQSMTGLVDDILKIDNKIQEARDLQKTGVEFIDELERLETEAREIKESYLAELDYEEWQIDNPRLKELEDKFTSYLERKTAKESVTDLEEMDTGSAGGELTMF